MTLARVAEAEMSVDGILNLNKPAGSTSFQMVNVLQRLSGQRRVGHGGTLDPAATGVLPICLGQATRLVEFLMDSRKTYRAEVQLGISTDTYDATGRIIHRGEASYITQERVESILPSFRGSFKQIPPMYSAVRQGGKRLYELARAGLEVERKARWAQVFHLELVDWRSPIFTLEVECGRGTYIRSLAHDLGQALGCGSHLRNLVRLRSGLFDIEDAVTLPQLKESFRYGYWQNLLYPIDLVLSHWKAVIVGQERERRIRNGRALTLGGEARPSSDGERCRAYSLDGRILALLRFEPERDVWQPDKVFSKGPSDNQGP